MKSSRKIITIILSINLLLIAIVAGSFSTFAYWNYGTSSKPTSTTPYMAVGVWEFIDPDRTTMPGLDDNLAKKLTQGGEGSTLIQDPNEPVPENVGLNNDQSLLNKEISKRQSRGFNDISSVDYYNGNNIRTALGMQPEDNFILKLPQDNPSVMTLYTTTVTTGKSYLIAPKYYIPKGERVYPVYKTDLVKNDQGLWIQVSCQVGSAEVGPYKSHVIAGLTSDTPIFIPETFIVEKRGNTLNKPIVLYYDQTFTHSLKKGDTAYFVIHGDGLDYNISTTSPKVKIIVQDDKGNLVAQNTGNSEAVTFTSTNYQDNIILVQGEGEITLTVK